MSSWEAFETSLRKACRNTFGVPVTYSPSITARPEFGGGSYETIAILDENREISHLGRMEVATPVATLDLRLADLAIDPMVGDEVTVAGVTYRLIDLIASQSSALLILTRTPDPFAS